MKHFKTLSLLTTLLFIAGAILKVLHLKYGDAPLYIGMLSQIIVQNVLPIYDGPAFKLKFK